MTPRGRGLGSGVPKAVPPGSGPARGLGHSGVGVRGARGGCGAAEGTGMGTTPQRGRVAQASCPLAPYNVTPPLQREEGDGSIEAAQPGLLIN